MRDLAEEKSSGVHRGAEAFHDEKLERSNPFTLPSDEEVFRMRDEERKRRAKERDDQRNLAVWQKNTAGHGTSFNRRPFLTGSKRRRSGAVRLKELIGTGGGGQVVMSKQARRIPPRLASFTFVTHST